jgi:hypothetical protein
MPSHDKGKPGYSLLPTPVKASHLDEDTSLGTPEFGYYYATTPNPRPASDKVLMFHLLYLVTASQDASH